MWSILVSLILLPTLSDPTWANRERAEAALGSAPWVVIDWAARNTECPEARMRLNAIRNRCTIRDLDLIAQGKWPAADDLWPGVYSREYEIGQWFGWPPEFHRAETDYGRYEEDQSDWQADQAKFQKRRTQCALTDYVSRTGDWDTVKRILK